MDNTEIAINYIKTVIVPLEKMRDEYNIYIKKKWFGANEEELNLLNNMNNTLVEKYSYLKKIIKD